MVVRFLRGHLVIIIHLLLFLVFLLHLSLAIAVLLLRLPRAVDLRVLRRLEPSLPVTRLTEHQVLQLALVLLITEVGGLLPEHLRRLLLVEAQPVGIVLQLNARRLHVQVFEVLPAHFRIVRFEQQEMLQIVLVRVDRTYRPTYLDEIILRVVAHVLDRAAHLVGRPRFLSGLRADAGAVWVSITLIAHP